MTSIRKIFIYTLVITVPGLILTGCMKTTSRDKSMPSKKPVAATQEFDIKDYVGPVALFEKGEELTRLGDYNGAIECFQKIINEHPDSILVNGALYNLGECHRKMGNTKDAIVYYSRLMSDDKHTIWTDLAEDSLRDLQKTSE